ncbi:MAG: DNA-binding MarR family transcriptional regulator [Bacteroidia bacterium]|jgi:DNA-binding MarR family transcriptional regulator
MILFVHTTIVQTMNYYYFVVLELVRTGHWLTDSVTRVLKGEDMYEPQFNVLRILQSMKGQPISVNAILDRMIQRSSNVTRIIDKLEAKGLANRVLSSKDRRKMDVVITSEGSELLKSLNKKVETFHQPLFKNLSTEEQQTLLHLIKKFKGEPV